MNLNFKKTHSNTIEVLVNKTNSSNIKFIPLQSNNDFANNISNRICVQYNAKFIFVFTINTDQFNEKSYIIKNKQKYVLENMDDINNFVEECINYTLKLTKYFDILNNNFYIETSIHFMDEITLLSRFNKNKIKIFINIDDNFIVIHKDVEYEFDSIEKMMESMILADYRKNVIDDVLRFFRLFYNNNKKKERKNNKNKNIIFCA